jgi:hypothetical protein
MAFEYEGRPLDERFDFLLDTISSKSFQAMEGLGNEAPFFICEFEVEETNEMYKAVKSLDIRLAQRGIRVRHINLYDLCIEILKSEGGLWDVVREEETAFPKDQLLEDFLGTFDAETQLPTQIADKTKGKDFDVLFITGVGEVYPYVRTHALLENLPTYVHRFPLVMFFPGKYIQTLHTGAMLKLFNRLNDGKYYRALNIFRYLP